VGKTKTRNTEDGSGSKRGGRLEGLGSVREGGIASGLKRASSSSKTSLAKSGDCNLNNEKVFRGFKVIKAAVGRTSHHAGYLLVPERDERSAVD
jgi:hypothetical protein